MDSPLWGPGTIAEAPKPVKAPPSAAALLDALVRMGTPGSFCLESGADSGGTMSIVGAAPTATLIAPAEDPLGALESFCSEPGLHVVALAYELGRELPVIGPRLSTTAQEDLGLPRLWCARYDAFYLRDERSGEAWLVGDGPAELALRELRALRPTAPRVGPAHSSLDRGDWCDAVRQILDYLHAGDCYQINLTRRVELPFAGRPLDLYLRLNSGHPARYGAWLDLGEAVIVSNSPERLLARRGDAIWSEPIKGTRRRGSDDAALGAALQQDPKERAEHTMIVDLVRNDLGRVSEVGSIEVDSLRRIETLPTLHHMVSTVRGRLRSDVGLAALLGALFPGGSVTGAPKLRAMQIIDTLEPVARGFYCGALGWISDRGRRLDLNLPIRTATLTGGRAVFGVGGGIVADSDPQREWEETELKARGLARAFGID